MNWSWKTPNQKLGWTKILYFSNYIFWDQNVNKNISFRTHLATAAMLSANQRRLGGKQNAPKKNQRRLGGKQNQRRFRNQASIHQLLPTLKLKKKGSRLDEVLALTLEYFIWIEIKNPWIFPAGLVDLKVSKFSRFRLGLDCELRLALKNGWFQFKKGFKKSSVPHLNSQHYFSWPCLYASDDVHRKKLVF